MPTRSAATGPNAISAAELRVVIKRAHREPFSVSSNFARTHAAYVAMAASKGFISTRLERDHYSRFWRVTVPGLQWLGVMEDK